MSRVVSIGIDFKRAVNEKTNGKVILISRRALLVDLNAKIFEILSSRMPRSTISAIVSKNDLNELDLAVGDPVECRKTIMLNGVELELDDAEVWTWDLKKADLKENLHKINVLNISTKIKNTLKERLSAELNYVVDPLLQTTIEKINYAFDLCEQYLEKNKIRSVDALLDLVGLGPGLTPAGDDTLAGFLTGSYYLASNGSQLFDVANLLKDKIHNKKTTVYSKRLLSLAANGISNEYVRGLILGIFDQNYFTATLYAKKILGLGATSGYFYLLGFIRGLEMAML